MLEKYLCSVRSVYFVGDEVSENVRFAEKPLFLQGSIEREKHRENWKSLLNSLKSEGRGRVKNMDSAGQNHSFTGILSYNSGLTGIVFSICFPLKLYGFRFAKMYESDVGKGYNETLSYLPFDEEMKKITKWLQDIIIEFFPNFELFDNTFADYKVNNIIINAHIYKELDLWKAFFSTNDHGII